MSVGYHLITGEYPPQAGGVGDYSRLLARELARCGDRVNVWAPHCAGDDQQEPGVEIHRLPGHFGPRALSILTRALRANPQDRIIVQYVPQAFGHRGMNLLFTSWLCAHRRRNIATMFHEVWYTISRRAPLRHNLVGVATRLMAAMAVRAADRIFVSTTAWEPLLRRIVAKSRPITCLPIPSNIPVVDDHAGAASVRDSCGAGEQLLLGHFGTYGEPITAMLDRIGAPLLDGLPHAKLLLLGRDGDRYRQQVIARYPHLAQRCFAPGALYADDVSRHVAACDLMLQPFPDGITTRRTSAMVALAHGRPLVTTSGALTERLWQESGAVALAPAGDLSAMVGLVRKLVDCPSRRTELGRAGRQLYSDNFDIRRTVAVLRESWT